MRRVSVVIGCFLVSIACSAPPQKEIDLAQGALDGARAAGAEQYAADSYQQAQTALNEANDAVKQRDYRLALTRALDAYERAQEAARNAAEGKARARSEAEAAIVALGKSLEQLQARIKAAETAKLPRRQLEAPRRTASAVEEDLQEARASLRAGDYLAARDSIKDAPDRISAQSTALEEAMAKKPVRPGGRTRR